MRCGAWGALMALGVLLGGGPAQAMGPPKVDDVAPDFHATLFDGRKVSLADYRGQVLIINFWATWCGPCRRELPLINAYYKLMQPHGLAVLAATSEDRVSDYQLKPLQGALAFPLAHSVHGPYRDLDALPTNYVIDRAGVVRYARAAAFSLDALNAVLVPLLNAPPPALSPSAAAAAPAGEGPRSTVP